MRNAVFFFKDTIPASKIMVTHKDGKIWQRLQQRAWLVKKMIELAEMAKLTGVIREKITFIRDWKPLMGFLCARKKNVNL